MSVSRPSDYVYPSLWTPCRAMTTANLTATYTPESPNSGINATLSNAGALAALVIDGVTLRVNDSVCVANQTSTLQNGLYEVLNAGSTSSAWQLIRRGDFQTSSQLRAGMHTPIGAGTVHGGHMAMLVEPLPALIGTDAVTFVAP